MSWQISTAQPHKPIGFACLRGYVCVSVYSREEKRKSLEVAGCTFSPDVARTGRRQSRSSTASARPCAFSRRSLICPTICVCSVPGARWRPDVEAAVREAAPMGAGPRRYPAAAGRRRDGQMHLHTRARHTIQVPTKVRTEHLLDVGFRVWPQVADANHLLHVLQAKGRAGDQAQGPVP